MARFKNRKRKNFVKPPIVKKQPNVNQVTGDKIPKSFVFSRGKIPGPIKQLELDIRKIMLPYTAIKLKVKLSSCQRIVLLNYDSDTKLIDFRHCSIRLQPVGVSRRIRKFVENHQVPDL